METDAGREHALDGQATFESVVTEHGGLLWRVAAVYEADPHLRQDLYQEILVAVWRALPRFRDEANLRTYLARIAHNRGVSHVDRAVKRPGESRLDPDLAAEVPGPARQAELAHRGRALQAAIEGLPLGWQQVVTLTLEGFPPREIAAVLGVPANVVSIRLSRAKRALREVMNGGHP